MRNVCRAVTGATVKPVATDTAKASIARASEIPKSVGQEFIGNDEGGMMNDERGT